MKTLDERKRFIEMRAKGISFDKISQELDISKPTLLKWSQDYSKEISNLIYFQFESLIAQFHLERSARVELLVMTLSKALTELKSRSFQELSVKELVGLIERTNEQLNKDLSSVRYTLDETIDPRTEWQEEMAVPKTLPFPY